MNDILKCTTIISAQKPNIGNSTGTGFFVNCKGNNFLVTNKHIIKDAESLKIILSKSKVESIDSSNIIEIVIDNCFTNKWILHSDSQTDLCALKIDSIIHDNAVFLHTIKEDDFITESQALELNVIQNIIMLGYPKGYIDLHNNLPLIRKGVLAVPYQYNFDGKNEFICDIISLSGSSGSPVFALIDDKNLMFIGMAFLSATYGAKGQIVKVNEKEPTISTLTETHSHVLRALKSSEILNFLNLSHTDI